MSGLCRLEEHRRLWGAKPVLERVYTPWFEALVAHAGPGARVLEVGAGLHRHLSLRAAKALIRSSRKPWRKREMLVSP